MKKDVLNATLVKGKKQQSQHHMHQNNLSFLEKFTTTKKDNNTADSKYVTEDIIETPSTCMLFIGGTLNINYKKIKL